MATFSGVEATIEERGIHLRFSMDAPRIVGWQIYDPSTGAFLLEGEWIKLDGPSIEMTIPLPDGDGPYRVQVAPVEDRARFGVIDARVTGDAVVMNRPRVTSTAAIARARLLRAIPKAFTYPPRSLWRNRKL